MYVESVKCKRFKKGEKEKAITFWNKEMLKNRERWEMSNGGFGQGKVKRLSIMPFNINELEEQIGNDYLQVRFVNNIYLKCSKNNYLKSNYVFSGEIQAEIGKMDGMLKAAVDYKKKMERRLISLYRNHSDNEEVLRLKESYNLLLEDKPCWEYVKTEKLTKTDELIRDLGDNEWQSEMPFVQNENDDHQQNIETDVGGNCFNQNFIQ